MVRTSCITLLSLLLLGLRSLPGWWQSSIFCLFWPSRFWTIEFALTFEYSNNFDKLDRGKVCSCAVVFDFVSAPLAGATTKCWSWKHGQICGFRPSVTTEYTKSVLEYIMGPVSDSGLAMIGKRVVTGAPKFIFTSVKFATFRRFCLV